ncbi:nucleotide-binding domain containing protein, partial [Bittarella massiliensis (ex Durand et al. 2017)]
LLHKGYGRIVVAGGETSGAVTKVLGYDVFEIGDSVAPGVPIMIPVQNKHIRLVLKSGNFGQVDFFTRALEMT